MLTTGHLPRLRACLWLTEVLQLCMTRRRRFRDNGDEGVKHMEGKGHYEKILDQTLAQ